MHDAGLTAAAAGAQAASSADAAAAVPEGLSAAQAGEGELQQVLPAGGAVAPSAAAPTAEPQASAQPSNTAGAATAPDGQPLGEAQSEEDADAALIAPPPAAAAAAATAAGGPDNLAPAAPVVGAAAAVGASDDDDIGEELVENEGLIEGEEEGGDTVLALYDKVRCFAVLACWLDMCSQWRFVVTCAVLELRVWSRARCSWQWLCCRHGHVGHALQFGWL